MLARLTPDNQVTIPKAIMERLPPIDSFNVFFRDGTVVLEPVSPSGTSTEAIRAKMRRLGLNEDSVADAVRLVREKA